MVKTLHTMVKALHVHRFSCPYLIKMVHVLHPICTPKEIILDGRTLIQHRLETTHPAEPLEKRMLSEGLPVYSRTEATSETIGLYMAIEIFHKWKVSCCHGDLGEPEEETYVCGMEASNHEECGMEANNH